MKRLLDTTDISVLQAGPFQGSDGRTVWEKWGAKNRVILLKVGRMYVTHR